MHGQKKNSKTCVHKNSGNRSVSGGHGQTFKPPPSIGARPPGQDRTQGKAPGLHWPPGTGKPGRTGRIDPGGSAPGKGQVIEPKAGEQTGPFCVAISLTQKKQREQREQREHHINRGFQGIGNGNTLRNNGNNKSAKNLNAIKNHSKTADI